MLAVCFLSEKADECQLQEATRGGREPRFAMWRGPAFPESLQVSETIVSLGLFVSPVLFRGFSTGSTAVKSPRSEDELLFGAADPSARVSNRLPCPTVFSFPAAASPSRLRSGFHDSWWVCWKRAKQLRS